MTTTKQTIMDTFKQYLQRKADAKRAELADIDAQTKRAEADELRKKASATPSATMNSSKLNPSVPF